MGFEQFELEKRVPVSIQGSNAVETDGSKTLPSLTSSVPAVQAHSQRRRMHENNPSLAIRRPEARRTPKSANDGPAEPRAARWAYARRGAALSTSRMISNVQVLVPLHAPTAATQQRGLRSCCQGKGSEDQSECQHCHTDSASTMLMSQSGKFYWRHNWSGVNARHGWEDLNRSDDKLISTSF
jgi:hypothetical protein